MPPENLLPEPAWVHDADFMHVYPLGACGAPATNDFQSVPAARLDRLLPWLDAWAALGVNAVYLGPVFESSTHGYDTADYFHVDRRLGDDAALARLVEGLHERGMKVVVDAVFHHVGRAFWAFRDVREKGEASQYRNWFAGLRFGARNRFGDPFVYQGWNGVEELVKLDLRQDAVRRHLFDAVAHWVQRFGIDGLRLDAADSIDLDFFDGLHAFCAGLERKLWLMGEVIHGDYRNWVRPGRLHSTTDYALWKALWSSHNDRNYFELAHTLKRQYAAGEGMYEALTLYTFADNHDVNRAASLLKESRHLPLLYLLLFTLPGIPSLYYGSEWGQQGRKEGGDDRPLRPPLPEPPGPPDQPPGLRAAIARYAALRHQHEVLRRGRYRELLVRSEQLAYARELGTESVVVVMNASDKPSDLVDLAMPGGVEGEWVDLLEPTRRFSLRGGRLSLGVLPPTTGRVLRRA
ncbi:alpha-amylase family glycosyl hydrolase [Pyxidicoccus caerfyrddinensis]|uniref:alpha-amylase family glycosyl hydrolase n=1 Tax=Pyxidicoccus caerfyrddinensis TaxID=2709663 RepID=UPI0013DBCE46|nr:alpha-amylase family glycosyl hydrolase [Pyxidicoccus caerfyrddinensis]